MTHVLVLDASPHDYFDALKARFPDVSFSLARNAQEVARELQNSQPNVVFSIKDPTFAGEIHRQAYTHDSVRWLQVGGSGYEHILPLDRPDVTVTYCAGVLAGHLAETVIGAMLAINGHLPRYLDQKRERVWQPIPFHPLSRQTLLIVGLGAIGERLAVNAKALGMQVLAVRRRLSSVPSVDELHAPEAISTLLPRADFISLHVRLDEGTRHLFDRNMLEFMKPGSVLINTARGGVVDTKALIDALNSGHLSGAYLDVFEEEPLPNSSPLWMLDNVILTPHASDNICRWRAEFASFFASNLERWLRGEPLENVVQT